MRIFAHSALLPRRWALDGGGMRVIGILAVLLGLAWSLFGVAAQARTAGTVLPAVADSADRPIVGAVRIEGNSHFSETQLKQRIRTAPNRRILSIPGVTWWRWIYQIGRAHV